MYLRMILKVALKSLLANKLRSVLAMLGIIIGVGAVISMMAIGAGAKKAVLEQFSKMGTNLLIVRPGQRGTGGVMSGTQQNLTLADAQALVAAPEVIETKGVKALSPVVGGNAQVKHGNRNTRVNVQGVAATYFAIRGFDIEKGTPFTDQDEERDSRVAVIGPVTADNLFGPDDPVGQTVKVNGINFRVVGVTKSKGDTGFFNMDDQVLIPYTTAMKQVFGSIGPVASAIREVDIEAAPDADLDKLQEAILAVMRKRHRVQPGAADDVTIRNQADILNQQSEAKDSMTRQLAGSAAISLLVGGIGIMNIMLVTVTERTREIGIRKAIGAKDKDILRQFLFEAIVMSGLGGLIGVLAGCGTALLIPQFSEKLTTVIQPASIVLSLAFSGAVGIFFGYYPALRAAKLDPIDALRYE